MSSNPAINSALLNFCMRADDGPRDPNAIPRRDPAELEWLKKALHSVETPDETSKRLLLKLASSECTVEEGIAVLEELQELVEDINLATEFNLLNGPRQILGLLSATNNERVRGLCAQLIAHATQNHQALQKAFLSLGVWDVILPLLGTESCADSRCHMILLISSMCRGSRECTSSFVRAGGLDVLLAALSHNQDDRRSVLRGLRVFECIADMDIALLGPAVVRFCCTVCKDAAAHVDARTSAARVLIHVLDEKSTPLPLQGAVKEDIRPALPELLSVHEEDFASEVKALQRLLV